jgi:transposase
VGRWWTAAPLAAAWGHAADDPTVRGDPCRWVVERSFACLGRFRRLSEDYEFLPATSKAVIHLAMVQLLVRRLARGN